jgi:FkbM family methyltransferase
MRLVPDWRWIVSKRIINRKWEQGFCVTFDTIFDHTEDFAKPFILSKGDLFIDAGAHCGFWSLQASKYYNRVIAIEPTPNTAKSLIANLRSNHARNVTVVQAALTDKVAFGMFYSWPGGPMGNSLFNDPVTYTDDYGHADEYYRVRTITIDSLSVFPTTIKLDVEGSEYDAIRGGLATIEQCHPKLFIEIHRPENEKKIVNVLPGYQWEKHQRFMQPEGKKEFYQTQMIGIYS